MVSVANVSKMHFSFKIKFQQAPNEMYNWLVAVQCWVLCRPCSCSYYPPNALVTTRCLHGIHQVGNPRNQNFPTIP